MNIQILDSWLREYVKTDATPKQIAEKLSLTSVSIERVEKWKDDYLYDIEITTNRPDLASVIGLAREASAVLPQFGIDATFLPLKLEIPKKNQKQKADLSITINENLVDRICAVVIEVKVGNSPKDMQARLASSGIRSLNNIIDTTNYVMRVTGHPTHIFDYDRIPLHRITVRESRKGEKIETLDKKVYTLSGGDIVADNGQGEIIDLLGVMGLANSVVTEDTKRIIFFINTNKKNFIRKTSMQLGIRTEAAQLNEKGIDPEIAYEALLYGIKLFEEIADGKVISEIIDIYPDKRKEKTIKISEEKIQQVIGVPIPLRKSAKILADLGFKTSSTETTLFVSVPSFRADDINTEEDLVEEIARVFGYHNIPSLLPPLSAIEISNPQSSLFSFEKQVKETLKYWGFTEIYTYSMVSETMFEGPTEEAVTIQNPLNEDFVYMRTSLVPSLLKVAEENKQHDTIQIFEIANVYKKHGQGLPLEKQHFAAVFKKPYLSFFVVKGIIEQLANDLGIHDLDFRNSEKGGSEVDVFVENNYLGTIEILASNLQNFELDFSVLLSHATRKKTYIPVNKFPPVLEDLSVIIDSTIQTGDIMKTIQRINSKIVGVTLLDKYENTRTFHITYQDREKNLTNEDITPIRNKIISAIKEKYRATLK